MELFGYIELFIPAIECSRQRRTKGRISPSKMSLASTLGIGTFDRA
jgi:hypothetical protein